MTISPELQAMLRALDEEFAAKLPARLQEIQDLLPSCGAHPAGLPHLATLHRLLHSLAGSAGSFGLADVGLEMRALEYRVGRCETEGRWDAQERQHIGSALQALQERLARNAANTPSP